MKTKNPNLSDSELKTLENLEKECANLDRHLSLTRVSNIAEATKAARDAYLASPSDKHLADYTDALHTESWLCMPPATNGPQLATTIHRARQAWVESRLKPAVAPVLDRAISAARKNYDSVKMAEAKKIEATLGHEYHEGIPSRPISEAREALAELEALSASIAATPKFFAAFREMFTA